jgi:hypothetical protein
VQGGHGSSNKKVSCFLDLKWLPSSSMSYFVDLTAMGDGLLVGWFNVGGAWVPAAGNGWVGLVLVHR